MNSSPGETLPSRLDESRLKQKEDYRRTPPLNFNFSKRMEALCMRIRVRFVPRAVAEYFASEAVELLEMPDGSRYRDLVEVLKSRFERASSMGSGKALHESLFDAFTLICDGVSILRKLDELIDPDKEVLVVTMALGG